MDNYEFIDLFSGIGGFHLALHELGGRCVYACEINKQARKVYEDNFRSISSGLFDEKKFDEDITNLGELRTYPHEADILCAGFPCQPYSIAGKQKGLDDPRANLFFEMGKIIAYSKPKVIFLENSSALCSAGRNRTAIYKIFKTLGEWGYGKIFDEILKASDYGLPTIRKRFYIVAFRNDLKFKDFKFPDKMPLRFTMSDLLGGKCDKEIGYTVRCGGRSSGINDRHNWDSYIVDGKVVKLTVNQTKKMMGFPEGFKFNVSEAQALKLLGNSVAINVIKAIGHEIFLILNKNRTNLLVG